MTFWLWFLVALAGWVLANAVIVLLLLGLGRVHDWASARRAPTTTSVQLADFALAHDLAKQRSARVLRQATAYRRLIDR